MVNLRDVFNKRAEQLNDHDPWRYGEALSLKSDLVEVNWVEKHMVEGSLLDMGCGTGRHCLELAERFPNLMFSCFDFASNTIRVLDDKIRESGITNIKTKVCGATEMREVYNDATFDNLLSIGLIQYLTDDELIKHFEDCSMLLSGKGRVLMKHPTSFTETFTFDGYSELLENRYVSKYRSFQDVIRFAHKYFSLLKIEPVFTLQNMTEEEYGEIEKSPDTRQMWFLFEKK